MPVGGSSPPPPETLSTSTSASLGSLPQGHGSFSVNISTNTSANAQANHNGAAGVNGANGSPGNGHATTGIPPTIVASHPALVNKPTFLELPKFRFLIMDAPNDANIGSYIEVLKKRQVVVVARVCDPTYSTTPLAAQGIKVVEVPFADGDPPPQHVVDRWLALVNQVFRDGGVNHPGRGVCDLVVDNVEKPAIAVHCVAGLGRAPVLVAIALVESGMEPFDAIAFIRKKRRGAINARQLKFIETYRPRNAVNACACVVQ